MLVLQDEHFLYGVRTNDLLGSYLETGG
jgi:hypothetical protein